MMFVSAFSPRSVDSLIVIPINVKLGTDVEHIGPLGHAKFYANRCTVMGTRLPKVENFHFLAESPRRDEPLTLKPISTILRPATLH